ncbi:hypothetical protein Fmac_019199 [Flemingia macrophylla]|uniref:Peroxidase n=1 Tax=Flemingia macrophylla TaxID=520843 RepID=A0ABD1M753_9FABA
MVLSLRIHYFIAVSILSLLACSTNAQLSINFYDRTCPNLQTIVRNAMEHAINGEPRLGASILRLFFHDCFVNGCDASILLDDTDTFVGEKNAVPNQNSVRGFELIDNIKSNVEAACNGTVSCADILALAARDGVVLLGGPSWAVPLGRRDARTASLSAANNEMPSPFSDLPTLTTMFAAKGLSSRDLTVLSGSHTIGQAQCQFFRTRIYNNNNNSSIDSSFAASRKVICPLDGGDFNLSPLESFTPNYFDNNYYSEIVANRALLNSDQVLLSDPLVGTYSTNNAAFFTDFSHAMVKMGNISPLTGTSGEIRKNCRLVN